MPPTRICLEYFEYHHLPPFVLFWLDLGFWDRVSLGTQSGLELALLTLVSPMCWEGWQACAALLGSAQLYFWLRIQRQGYETPPHTRWEAFTETTLKNNPLDSFQPGEERSQWIPKYVRIRSVCSALPSDTRDTKQLWIWEAEGF